MRRAPTIFVLCLTVVWIPALLPGQRFAQHTISLEADGAESVFAIDLDSDGDIDVLSASKWDDKIAWYENDGNQGFDTHVITTDADGAQSVFASDLDSDGDVDVLSASEWDNKVAWYENDGNQGFNLHVISSDAGGASSVFAADIDGDGDTDVISASEHDDKISWYENDGAAGFVDHTISSSADGAISVHAADVDGDGDIDVLSASQWDHKVAWYENDGAQGFITHIITTEARTVVSVFAIDVDADGDVDVISLADENPGLAWYENDGQEEFTAHTIGGFWEPCCKQPASLYAADVDGDGDVDLLSAYSAFNDKLSWHENDGQEGFTRHIIANPQDADEPTSAFAIDVDADGDMDVISASEADDQIAWWENVTPPVIPCDAITGFKSECQADLTISARVTLSDSSYDREFIEIRIDSLDVYTAQIIGRTALVTTGPYDQGQHTVELGSAPDCLAPLTVRCEPVGQNPQVEELPEVQSLPNATALFPSHPNPFNPTTTIPYQLPEAQNVRLAVYDLLGREVASLVSGSVESGYHEVVWDGTNSAGEHVASGIYLYRMTAGEFSQTRRMLLMR